MILHHGFALNLQIKQYVAVVKSRTGNRFRVFETGDAKFWLFELLDRDGCSTTIHIPVRKTDVVPDVRRALRHGWGNAEATGDC